MASSSAAAAAAAATAAASGPSLVHSAVVSHCAELGLPFSSALIDQSVALHPNSAEAAIEWMLNQTTTAEAEAVAADARRRAGDAAPPLPVLAPTSDEEEQDDIARAIAASMKDDRAMSAAAAAPAASSSSAAAASSSSPAAAARRPASKSGAAAAGGARAGAHSPSFIPLSGSPPFSALPPPAPPAASAYRPPGLRRDNPLYVKLSGPQHSSSSILPAAAYYANADHDAAKANRSRHVSVLNAVAAAPQATAPPPTHRNETASGFAGLLEDQSKQNAEIARNSMHDSGITRLFVASADEAPTLPLPSVKPGATVVNGTAAAAHHSAAGGKKKRSRSRSPAMPVSMPTTAAASVPSKPAPSAMPPSAEWTPLQRAQHDRKMHEAQAATAAATTSAVAKRARITPAASGASSSSAAASSVAPDSPASSASHSVVDAAFEDDDDVAILENISHSQDERDSFIDTVQEQPKSAGDTAQLKKEGSDEEDDEDDDEEESDDDEDEGDHDLAVSPIVKRTSAKPEIVNLDDDEDEEMKDAPPVAKEPIARGPLPAHPVSVLSPVSRSTVRVRTATSGPMKGKVQLELQDSSDEEAEASTPTVEQAAAAATAWSPSRKAASSAAVAAAGVSVAASPAPSPSRSSSFRHPAPRAHLTPAEIRARLSLSLYCPLLCLNAEVDLKPGERVGPHKQAFNRTLQKAKPAAATLGPDGVPIPPVAAVGGAGASDAASSSAAAASAAPARPRQTLKAWRLAVAARNGLERGLEELPSGHLIFRRSKEIFADRCALDNQIEAQAAAVADPEKRQRLWDRYDAAVEKLDDEDDLIIEELEQRQNDLRAMQKQRHLFWSTQDDLEIDHETANGGDDAEEQTDNHPMNDAEGAAAATADGGGSEEAADDVDEYPHALIDDVDQLSDSDSDIEEDDEEDDAAAAANTPTAAAAPLPQPTGHVYIEETIVKLEKEYTALGQTSGDITDTPPATAAAIPSPSPAAAAASSVVQFDDHAARKSLPPPPAAAAGNSIASLMAPSLAKISAPGAWGPAPGAIPILAALPLNGTPAATSSRTTAAIPELVPISVPAVRRKAAPATTAAVPPVPAAAAAASAPSLGARSPVLAPAHLPVAVPVPATAATAPIEVSSISPVTGLPPLLPFTPAAAAAAAAGSGAVSASPASVVPMPPVDRGSQAYSNWYWKHGPGSKPGHPKPEEMYGLRMKKETKDKAASAAGASGTSEAATTAAAAGGAVAAAAEPTPPKKSSIEDAIDLTND